MHCCSWTTQIPTPPSRPVLTSTLQMVTLQPALIFPEHTLSMLSALEPMTLKPRTLTFTSRQPREHQQSRPWPARMPKTLHLNLPERLTQVSLCTQQEPELMLYD